MEKQYDVYKRTCQFNNRMALVVIIVSSSNIFFLWSKNITACLPELALLHHHK